MAYSRRAWASNVLVPLWVIQFILLPLLIFTFAALVMEYTADLGAVPASAVGQLTFFSLCFLLLPLEITGYLYDFLNPWMFLASQVFKSLFWTLCIGVAIYNFTISAPVGKMFWNYWRIVDLAFTVLLSLTFYVALSYAGVMVHRHRTGGINYASMSYRRSKSQGAPGEA